MAVTPSTFKNLTFGGINSADYGVYISGEGVYNAPARAVELTQIPGRNGAIPVDLGRWENIEITYPCGMFGSDQTDFAANYSDFINAIASQKGYQRLEDTYHPDEFRQALFVSGVETKPIGFGQAGEFELVFNCKPQRFLKSGETAVAISSGGSITNPTLLDSSPLLAVRGYGNIDLNGYELEIYNATLGDVEVSQAIQETKVGYDAINRAVRVYFINTDLLNAGDTIHISGITETLVENVGNYNDISVTFLDRDGITATRQISKPNVTFNIAYNAVDIVYGTSSSWTTHLYADISFAGGGGSQTVSAYVDFYYSGGNNIKITFRQYTYQDTQTINIPAFIGVSTQSTLGDPTYLDCEIGEAYLINNGELVPLNNVVEFGADLPKLEHGANSVSYDVTVTSLEITPRWWKL